MAYEARSNVCRSAVTYSGLSSRTFGLTIGGVNRLGDARQSVNFTLTKKLDSTSSLAMRLGGTRPAEGADIILTLGGELLFGGTVQRVQSEQKGPLLMEWDIAATDWWWLLSRYAYVTGRFAGGVNSVVGRILHTYTDGGFLPGYLPQSLGNVDLTFDGVSVGDALKRIAKGANAGSGAFLRLTPFKRVDIATSFPDGVSLALSDGANRQRVVTERILDQVRTRVIALGAATGVTANVSSTATTLPIEECGLFASSGTVWVDGMGAVTFSGRSVASGPGELTGVSGLMADVPQGGAVRVYALAEDGTAQSSLATTLGGGRSGIAVHTVSNDAWSLGECEGMAGAHLALLKDPQVSLTVQAVAMSAAEMEQQEPGAILTASVTTPQTISGDFRLQSVTVRAFGPLSDSQPRFSVSIAARNTVGVDLFDLLGTLS